MEGNRVSKKEIKIRPEKIDMGGTHNLVSRIRQNKERTDAINNLNPPTSTKTLISFL